MHHLKNLSQQYKAEHKYKSDLSDFQYNFVKVECTSTYPRLIFVMKFLPVLTGVGLIQVFSQNKLSRNTENDKSYKEFQIFCGSDIKLNSNIDFIYHEPKKLKEIERFFLEFFITTKVNDELFHDTSHDLRYFDYSLFAIMDEVMTTEKISFTINNPNLNNNLNNNNNNNLLSNNNNYNKNNNINISSKQTVSTTNNPEIGQNSNLSANNFLIENILFKINNIYSEFYVNGNEFERLKIVDDNSNDVISNNRNILNDEASNNNNNNYNNQNNLNTNTNNNNFYNINFNNRDDVQTRKNLPTNVNINNLNHNVSESATLQIFSPNFLNINKELFIKEILAITNNFTNLNIHSYANATSHNPNFHMNNSRIIAKPYDNTLILTRNDITNGNCHNISGHYYGNNMQNYLYNNLNYEHSLDLTNKFSDLSALDDDKNFAYYHNHTNSNLAAGNPVTPHHRHNAMNNISASFDVILSSLHPRNVNTDAGYESQVVTTNMIMANINTININNSICDPANLGNNFNNNNNNNKNINIQQTNPNYPNTNANNNNNLSLVGNNPLTNCNNNLNTTQSLSDNLINNNGNGIVYNTVANLSGINNNNNFNNLNSNSNNKPMGSGLRVNTLSSFTKQVQNTDKPQINIHNMASPFRNKLITSNNINNINNMNNNANQIPHMNGIPLKPLTRKQTTTSVNSRGSQGYSENNKIQKINLILNQQQQLINFEMQNLMHSNSNNNFINSGASSFRNFQANKGNSEKIQNFYQNVNSNKQLHNSNSRKAVNLLNKNFATQANNLNIINSNPSALGYVNANTNAHPHTNNMYINPLHNNFEGKGVAVGNNPYRRDNYSRGSFDQKRSRNSKSQNSVASEVIVDEHYNIQNVKGK